MSNVLLGTLAEGVPDRRQVLAGLAAAVAACALPAVAVASAGADPYASTVFTGAGWYVLGGAETGEPERIAWAHRDGHPYIALSEAEDGPAEVYINHRRFDRLARRADPVSERLIRCFRALPEGSQRIARRLIREELRRRTDGAL